MHQTSLLLSVIRVTKVTAQTSLKYDPVIYDALFFVERRNILPLCFGGGGATVEFEFLMSIVVKANIV
jgi:hypothetical protein